MHHISKTTIYPLYNQQKIKANTYQFVITSIFYSLVFSESELKLLIFGSLGIIDHFGTVCSNCRYIQYLTVGPLHAWSKCFVHPNPLKIPVEQFKLNIIMKYVLFCILCFLKEGVEAPLSTACQLYNKGSPVRSPLIQSCLSCDTEKRRI